MRFYVHATIFVVALVIVEFVVPARPTTAAPYCPNPAHAAPAKVPPDLMAAVQRLFKSTPARQTEQPSYVVWNKN